jgi:non-heme chloroperoxidase
MPYFSTPTDGTTLHYLDHGPTDGPVVVLLNSSYFGAVIWEQEMGLLAADGFRCVCLERRGHGRSDDAWGGFDLDTLAEDVTALIELLDLRDITLVAHSIGAMEAVRHLTRHGSGRVARRGLVAPITPSVIRTPDNPGAPDPEATAAGRAWMRRDRYAFFDDGLRAFFNLDSPGIDISPGRVRHLAERIRDSSPHACAALLDLATSSDLAPELPKVDVPALVIHGTHDVSAPLSYTGRPTAELIPGARLLTYENAGHGLFATHADRLAADIAAFARDRLD